MKRFKKALSDMDIVDSIRFQQPLDENPEKAKKEASNWAKKIIENFKTEI